MILKWLFPGRTPKSDDSLSSGGDNAAEAPGASPFIPNSELERLLVGAATDPSLRSVFNRELLRENLFVATPEAPQEVGHRVLEQDEVLSIMNVGSADGLVLPAIFSSEKRLVECFGVGTGFVAMSGAVLLDIVQDSGAVLNPASAYGVQWSRSDLAVILGKPVRRVVQKDTQLTLGEPSQRPEQLISKLIPALDDDARVQEAWLALAHWPETDEWSWYLDVRSSCKSDEISPSLGKVCQPELLEGKPIDIVVNSPIGASGTGIRLKPRTNH
ncbi:MAG: enhanced serine sensitivity protein SseB C-terminal domain-containing protein [Sphingomicrobium sp.]|nr:enhanced serine sensitivity protein SseB C-terminal domain-containing protein [Sphingomonadales bacterium]